MRITQHEQVPAPTSPEMWVHRLDAELWRQAVTDLFGNADLGETAERRWANAALPQYSRSLNFVAHVDDRPVGSAILELPQADNRDVAYLHVVVDAGHRERGIGGALFDAAQRVAMAQGRTSLQGQTYDPLVPTGTRRIRGTHGDGEIDPASPQARFALSRGFRLMQVETFSRLILGPLNELKAMATRAREGVPGEYEIDTWNGPGTSARARDVAALLAALSTDIPTGGATLEEEHYDAERVAAQNRVFAEAGIETIVTAARHRPTGRLVAMTRIIKDPSLDETADQWETIVQRDHRGHGLGLAIKAVNHAAAAARWPKLERLITSNASENEHILRINNSLGYRPFAASGSYEKSLSPTTSPSRSA